MGDLFRRIHFDNRKGMPALPAQEDPRMIVILIVIVTFATMATALFSLEHGIYDLYPYLFLLPIIMTAYYFPKFGILSSVIMGGLLILINVAITGIQVPVLTRTLFTLVVFLGIGGIITILSQNISGLRQRYQDVFSQSETGIVIFDAKTGEIADANMGFLIPLGYSTDPSGYRTFDRFFDVSAQYQELVREVKSGGRVTGKTVQLHSRGGSSCFFQVSASAFGDVLILCTLVDVTERRQYVESLRKSLAEKEILFKEVHHRVKNNMQVIMSLLDLNALHAANDEERTKYAEMQGRVMTMALIHEKLYQSPVTGVIDAESYFTALLKNIVSASVFPGITCTVSAAQVYLDIDKAIPCGLIVNELATNSLKYAFDSQEGAKIQLSLAIGNTGHCLLDFSDNGKGLRKTEIPSSTETLGIRLINMLVRQLGGTITTINEKGTHYFIRFPLNPQELKWSIPEKQQRAQTNFSQWCQ